MGKTLQACISLFAFPLPRAHTAAADPARSPSLLPGHVGKTQRQQQEKRDAAKKQLKGVSRCEASAAAEWDEAAVEEEGFCTPWTLARHEPCSITTVEGKALLVTVCSTRGAQHGNAESHRLEKTFNINKSSHCEELH